MSEENSGRVGGVGLLVLLLFFLSGACGLVYEVVWSRMLFHIFGSTAVAVGTVLGAFMSGLAAGAWLVGRVADRRTDPLRLYAWLEIGAGLTAVVAHTLLARVTPLYLALHEVFGRWDAILGLARFLLAFGLVMIPTMLMGATLPVLTRFFVRNIATAGARLSTLYAVNTLGAVTGALLAGFFLIGAVGLNRSVHLAVLGNLGVGIVAMILAARVAPTPLAAPPAPPRRKKGTPVPDVPGQRAFRLLLLGLAVTGLTSFAYEIFWTRALVFFVGNSTYAVTTMLTAFLAGIALGGYLARFLVDRVADRVALFGWTQILVGLTSAAALPALFAVAAPQTIRGFLGQSWDQAVPLLLSRFGLSLAVMLVPATLIGATFPIVARISVRDPGKTGSAVGSTYAVNTIGNVVGALLPGLFLLHWLGIVKGIVAMAVLNACVGLAALGSRVRRRAYLRWALPLATLATLLVLARVPLEFRFPTEAQGSWHRVLYYREGPSATTAVLLDPDIREKSMSVDGVDIGGNAFTDYKQQLLAHLPKLLADEVSPELSIGLGSGILVGESLRHDGVRELTCVEIEPSVVAGAELFASENHGVLEDARLRVVVDDVANYLRTAPSVFRVISADEKTAQEYASNGFSYSAEYYELLRNRLAPGGLVAQWVPTSLPHSQYRMILRTFSESFPHVQLWYFPPAFQIGTYNTVLVGSEEAIDVEATAVRRRLESGAAAFDGLARYGLTSAEAVLVHRIADGNALRDAVADAPVNTLDHPRYEFYSPREYAVPRGKRLALNLELIERLRHTAAASNLAQMSRRGAEPRLERSLVAELAFTDAYRTSLDGPPSEGMFRRFDDAVTLAPWNENLRSRIYVRYFEMSTDYSNAGNYPAAAELLRRGLSADGRNPMGHVVQSMLLGRTGSHDEAAAEARTAVDLDPRLVAARRALADALLNQGRTDAAVEQLRALLSLVPDDVAARELLARLGAAP